MNEKNDTAMKKIDRAVFKVTKAFSYVSAIALIAIAVLCTADVICIKVLGISGIQNATDMVTYLNIPVVFLAIAFIQVERGHTSIDLLMNHFPKALRNIIVCFGNLLGAAVCGFASWRIVLLTIEKYQKMSTASAGRNSFLVWPFAAIVALGFALLGLAMLWCIVRDITIPKEEQCGYVPMEMGYTGDEEEEGGAEE